MIARKTVLAVLMVVSVAGIAIAAGQRGAQTQGSPEKISLTVFGWVGPYTKDPVNNYFWKKYEEATGIHAIVEMVPQVSYQEQVNLRWSSNTLPDVLFKASIDVPAFAADGAIVPIDPYLRQYAPNLSRYMAEKPDIERNIKLADGHIYGFPYLVTASTTQPKLFVNKKWLDSTGRPMPTTTEELKDLATLFYNSDWNKNGQKDEIPIMSEYPQMIYKALLGSFGFTAAGSYSESWDIDPATKRLRYIYATDQGRKLLTYLNDLYKNKLIYQEFFTVDIPRFTAEAQQNRIGFAFIHNSLYLDTAEADFAALPGPFTGPDGDKNYIGFNSEIGGQTAFITKNNKYPAETVKWIDYLYSDEGICLYFMGEKDVTYYIDANGDPQFTDYVRKNPNGMSMEEALGNYVIWSGGGNPTVADAKHFANHLLPQITADSVANLAPYKPQNVWGSFPFSQADNERLAILNTDIGTYVSEMRAKFIRGDESLNNWNAYVQQLNSMGLRELTEIMQRGYDAYSK
ncbi:MAG: extracellular solute-binding protein [Treponema sp.]|jgi:putative aldouronate transport system substrate-binding protein|nr:extracellular solute-binding protein [Treponema sp.]